MGLFMLLYFCSCSTVNETPHSEPRINAVLAKAYTVRGARCNNYLTFAAFSAASLALRAAASWTRVCAASTLDI